MLTGTITGYNPETEVGIIRPDEIGQAEVRFRMSDILPREMVEVLVSKGVAVEYCPNGESGDGYTDVSWVLVELWEPGNPEVELPSGRVSVRLPYFYEKTGVGFFTLQDRWVEVPVTEFYLGKGLAGGKIDAGSEISCRIEQRPNGTLIARDVWIVAKPAQVRIRSQRTGGG